MAMEKRSGGFVSAESGKIVGYAAVFGPLSEDLGGFRERVDPAAFNKTLKSNKDVRAFLNHDTTLVLGCRSTGTLQLDTDTNGLRVEIALPDTSYARDLRALMERGDVRQMSFAFLTNPGGDKWDGKTEDGLKIRTLTDVELVEVSVVSIPAYPDTSAAIRSMRGHEVLLMRERQLWMARNRTSPWWRGR